MQIMRMEYDDLALMSGKATLHVYGLGTFKVFSGRERYINNPNCTAIPDYGAIPVGQYYIVDRPPSSIGNTIKNFGGDLINGTNHNEWLGLFNSETMSDHVFVNGVQRGGFRLHPLRPNGSGESWGCITFFSVPDFQTVRSRLINTKQSRVPGSRNGLLAYGRVDVRGISRFEKCN
ncbi:DUF2778 domain-containing protein [Serratia sp. PGPR-27]|uniref:DUF2778 domain-containing protein n=1 Tax=Serratia TaxID=613 RepID=UPI00143E9CCF|nr:MULTISPECIES: DUF2778 domain-containing protein [Serratia]MBH2601413.1 DUF2778 domain-containing protein [Serratia marcescens]MBH2890643.1 DUF2778 domain-containing protein [Serratia marcescens]MBN5391742.1 DUF2778 domain-containing protein [Serratia marcescens]MCI2402510.1 DUF2778 domain-containing protein [Serratia sp. PGPR-27]MDY7608033.1 DUF2778 domain-containing protein [Serratia marcescens]